VPSSGHRAVAGRNHAEVDGRSVRGELIVRSLPTGSRAPGRRATPGDLDGCAGARVAARSRAR